MEDGMTSAKIRKSPIRVISAKFFRRFAYGVSLEGILRRNWRLALEPRQSKRKRKLSERRLSSSAQIITAKY